MLGVLSLSTQTWAIRTCDRTVPMDRPAKGIRVIEGGALDGLIGGAPDGLDQLLVIRVRRIIIHQALGITYGFLPVAQCKIESGNSHFRISEQHIHKPSGHSGYIIFMQFQKLTVLFQIDPGLYLSCLDFRGLEIIKERILNIKMEAVLPFL